MSSGGTSPRNPAEIAAHGIPPAGHAAGIHGGIGGVPGGTRMVAADVGGPPQAGAGIAPTTAEPAVTVNAEHGTGMGAAGVPPMHGPANTGISVRTSTSSSGGMPGGLGAIKPKAASSST